MSARGRLSGLTSRWLSGSKSSTSLISPVEMHFRYSQGAVVEARDDFLPYRSTTHDEHSFHFRRQSDELNGILRTFSTATA
jgi:hypothetical protein